MSVKYQVSFDQKSHTLAKHRQKPRKENRGRKEIREEKKTRKSSGSIRIKWWDSLGHNWSQTSWEIFLRMVSKNLLKGRASKLWTTVANLWHWGMQVTAP